MHAARPNGIGKPVGACGYKDYDAVVRRLFQCLKKRIGGINVHLVRVVNDEYLLLTLVWSQGKYLFGAPDRFYLEFIIFGEQGGDIWMDLFVDLRARDAAVACV